nr:thioredoxin Y1, chloroplastic [Ipomoea batatas]
MAISAKAAALYSLNTKHRSAAAPLTSPSTSLQLPRQLRCVRIGFHGSDPQSRPRTLPLVQAKETFSSFDDVLENSDKPVLVDFYATWCGPCQFMVPILNDVGNAMKDKIQVVKIDTEKYPSIADRHGCEVYNSISAALALHIFSSVAELLSLSSSAELAMLSWGSTNPQELGWLTSATAKGWPIHVMAPRLSSFVDEHSLDLESSTSASLLIHGSSETSSDAFRLSSTLNVAMRLS